MPPNSELSNVAATVSITVKRDFTYQDTDLLLVFRKPGNNDLLFNLGTVRSYLGQAIGAMPDGHTYATALPSSNFGSTLGRLQ